MDAAGGVVPVAAEFGGGELAGGVVEVLQRLPAGVGGAGQQALGVVAVADAAGVAVDQALGFGGDAAVSVALIGGGAAGVEDFGGAVDAGRGNARNADV